MPKVVGAIAILALGASCSEPVEHDKGPAIRSNAVEAPSPMPAKARPTIDPKSNAAAEELAHSFARLLNAGKFDEAYMLFAAGAPQRKEFDRWFKPYSNLDVRVGAAGGEEGAAGSTYLSVPLTITGRLGARQVDRSAIVIFRRVNEIPGSTEAERHWHIERIDWKDPT